MQCEVTINIDENEKRLIRLREGLIILQWAPAYCSNFPKRMKFDKVLQLSHVYARYTNRMCYHAGNFLDALKKLLSSQLPEPNSDHELFTPIDDGLYWEFDSFIWSAKSLVEGNIRERAKALDPKIVQVFLQTGKLHLDEFIDPFLSPLRNEVVHINQFGSSLSSQISLKNENGKIKVSMRSVLGPFVEEKVDLIEVFGCTFGRMEEVFRDVSGLLLSHIFGRWGLPLEPSKIFINKSIDMSYFRLLN